MRDLLKQALRFPFLFFIRMASVIWPSSPKHIALSAWWGTLYSDNPKYLFLYLANRSDLHFHWIGDKGLADKLPQFSNTDFSEKGSIRAFLNILSSKYVICTHAYFLDFSSLPMFSRKLCLNVWHGIPVKFFGNGLRSHDESKTAQRLIVDSLYKWLTKPPFQIVTPVASKRMAELCSMQNNNNFGEFLPVGTPRNDFLVNNRNNSSLLSELRHKYANMLGFDADKKIILYMPTFRSSGKNVFAFYELEEPKLSFFKVMTHEHNAVLIEKHHWMTYVQHPLVHQSDATIAITKDQQTEVDVQELLLITDILICDYSSAYIDFGLLERPCIHFTYDLEEYAKKDSGLAYDIEQVAAGPIVRTFSELLDKLSELLSTPVFQPAPHFHDLIEYETGHACEQLARFMGIKVGEGAIKKDYRQ